MDNSFDLILDACLDRIQAGENLESVLAAYPAQAKALRPLLQVAVQARESLFFDPSTEAKQASRRRFNSALTEAREGRRNRQSWFATLVRRPATWATVATVAVALVAVYIGVRPVLSPGAPVVLPVTPIPSATGNFAFLVSDDVNAIAEFNDVTVSIERFGLQRAEDDKWIEVTPEVMAVDLTKVPGALTQQIWRGDIPAGDYKQVFIYAGNVTGTLKSTGERTEIKLPSQRLHLAIPFSVSDSAVTSFTYDMTVFRTGNDRNAKYILKPQLSDSGATQAPDQSNNERNRPTTPNPEQRPTSLPTPSGKPPKK